MPNTVIKTKLLDGPRQVIYHIYIKSDGKSGEVINYPVIDPAEYNLKGPSFAIESVTWGFNGFTGKFKFDYLADGTLVWVLPSSAANHVDFEPYGALTDRSSKLDGSGKILFSTIGMGDWGDEGSFVIKIRKTSASKQQVF